MPELPEVETTKRGIAPHIEGKTLTSAIIRQSRLRWPVPDMSPFYEQSLKGISRRSKYLLLHFDTGDIMIHLGMSGKLAIIKEAQQKSLKKHDHIDLCFGDTILRYNDPRRFGSFLLNHDGEKHPLLNKLGPEPLDRAFSSSYLTQCCEKTSRPIKSVIMDSHIVVGVGNIYACESLFLSGIHPITPANGIEKIALQQLTKNIKSTLRKAIKAGGTTLKDFLSPDGNAGYFSQKLQVYGRENLACYQCQSGIENCKLSNRSSFYCPSCQPLASRGKTNHHRSVSTS